MLHEFEESDANANARHTGRAAPRPRPGSGADLHNPWMGWTDGTLLGGVDSPLKELRVLTGL